MVLRNRARSEVQKGPVKQSGRRDVAIYPCPRCGDRLYADQEISYGCTNLDGVKHISKYHTECKE
jgi:hypothetical protein